MRRLSIAQSVIACVVLIAATVARHSHDITGDQLVMLYTAIAGYALGYVNGNKTTMNELGKTTDALHGRLSAVEAQKG